MFSIPTPQTLAAKALVAVIGVGLVAAGGAYGGYRWELGAYNGLKAAQAKALLTAASEAAAKQKRIDDGNQADAVAQAYFAGKLAATTVTLKTETPANVTILQDQQAAAADHAGCVTFGFARVLYAGAHGIPAASVSIPSGESVDSCTATDPSDLAAAVAQDLAAGYGNGHQLDSLIAAVKRNDAILTTK